MKRILLVLAVILVLITGLRLLLKSDFVLNQVRIYIENSAAEMLNGSLSVDKLSGDLLTGLTATGIRVSDSDGGNPVKLDTLHIGYSISSLLNDPLTLDGIIITGLQADLIENEQEIWNLMQLLPESETAEEDSDPFYWYVRFLRVKNSSLSITSPKLPRGDLTLRNIELVSSGGLTKGGILAEIDDLRFDADPAPDQSDASLMLKGAGSGKNVNLEYLVLSTGRSLLSAAGTYGEKSGFDFNARSVPLSWLDLAQFTDEPYFKKNMNARLTLAGSIDDLRLELEADFEADEKLNVFISMDASEQPILKELNFRISDFDGPSLTGNDSLPTFSLFNYKGNGILNLNEPENSNWAGSLNISDLAISPVSLDDITADMSLKYDTLEIDILLNKNQQIVNGNAFVAGLFSDLPDWSASVISSNLKPDTWIEEFEADANINLSADVNGQGFSLSDNPVNFEVELNESEFNNIPVKSIGISGVLTANLINGNFSASLDRSSVNTRFRVQNWQGVPSYSADGTVDSFNFAELKEFEDFPTAINASFSGSGSGLDFNSMDLLLSINADSSIVNGKQINWFNSELQINKGLLQITDTRLLSDIADATAFATFNLQNLQDPGNNLDFDVEIKNPNPLAPLFNAEILAGTGTINGKVTNLESGVAVISNRLDLTQFRIDSLLTIDQITGNSKITLYENPEALISLSLENPVIKNFLIQDFNLMTNFTIDDSLTTGDIEMNLINDTESTLHQAGTFTLLGSNFIIENDKFTFVTPYRSFFLQKPFRAGWSNSRLMTNTLLLETSDSEAFVKLEIPALDSLNQNINFEASKLNLGVLQRTLSAQSIADGFFSGQLLLQNSPDSLFLEATGQIDQLEMNDGAMDSLIVDATVQNEWLDITLEGWQNSSSLMQGALRVPFLPGDPVTFDEQFFDRNINGRFQINASRLSYWLSFLEDLKYKQTDGTLFFEGLVAGTAGNPEFTGRFRATEGTVSGIRVDSLNVNLNYLHEYDAIDFGGALISHNQEVLDFSSRFPFGINLKRFEILLPEESDSLSFEMRTSDFNLAILNNFLPAESMNQAKGRLNGNVTLSGTLENIKSSGSLRLNSGGIRIVPARINLEDINSTLRLQPGSVELQNFSVKSGPGRLNASGKMELENLIPGQMDVQVKANRFRLSNTDKVRAIIDLNSRIEGNAVSPIVTGTLTFLNGFYTLQNFGEKAVEDVQLEGEDRAPEVAYYDSLKMDLSVEFNRNFFIRNSQFLEMEVELAGQLDLLKSKEKEIEIFGTIEGVSGFARPLGKNFTIENAVVSFTGPPDNPYLNIRTEFKPPQPQTDVTIFYIIEGPADDPSFRFESEPEMELQDILSYTLFGQPFYALEPWQQSVSSSNRGGVASDIAFEFLLDRVESIATQQLGIDVVQIDNTRSGTNSTTSIKTGWYINRRTFFALLNELTSSTPKTLFILEYLLRDNLELIITQGDDPRQGVDLRWKLDY